MYNTTPELRETLRAVLVAYDADQYRRSISPSKRKVYHNPHAHGLYMEALESVCSDINSGATQREALIKHFTGHLLNTLLKALKMDKATDAEQRMTW